jgi:hypothetical protein
MFRREDFECNYSNISISLLIYVALHMIDGLNECAIEAESVNRDIAYVNWKYLSKYSFTLLLYDLALQDFFLLH